MFKCCRYCNNREVGCHSVCGRYLIAKRAFDLRSAKIRTARESDGFYRERTPRATRRAAARGAR